VPRHRDCDNVAANVPSTAAARTLRLADYRFTVPAKIVCVVDDEASVRHSTGALIRSLGWQAAFFDSAEAFLSRPDATRFACLICDIQLAAMCGLDLQRRLRDLGDPTPIIFVTAHATPSNRAKALDHGAAAILDKPVDPDALIACLCTVLGAPP